MAILNVTPDSFYAPSRVADRVVDAAQQALQDGAQILDIGACSTRPDSQTASEEEEWQRLEPALKALRIALPEARLSIDTFRSEIAKLALEHFGPMVINDVSGGCREMYNIVRQYNVPYIWTLRGNLSLPEHHPELSDINLILDPGFGFIASPKADYDCLRQMDRLQTYNRPILVGVSRKSMVYKPLGLTPETCLTPTQALHLYALEHGATILRTHDVRDTMQIITLWQQINNT